MLPNCSVGIQLWVYAEIFSPLCSLFHRLEYSTASALSHFFLSQAKKQGAQPTPVSYQPVAVIRSMFQQHGLETPPSNVSVLPVTICLLMAVNQ